MKNKKILEIYWNEEDGETKFEWVKKKYFGIERLDIYNDIIVEIDKKLDPDHYQEDYGGKGTKRKPNQLGPKIVFEDTSEYEKVDCQNCGAVYENKNGLCSNCGQIYDTEEAKEEPNAN